MGGVSQRGGAPGTRETDLLDPLNMVDKVNAIVLSGGSAFGLDAAQGVVRYLDEHNIGYKIGRGRGPDRARGDPVRSRVRRRPEDQADRRLRLQGRFHGVGWARGGGQRRRWRGRHRRQDGRRCRARRISTRTPPAHEGRDRFRRHLSSERTRCRSHCRGQRCRRHHRSRHGQGRRRFAQSDDNTLADIRKLLRGGGDRHAAARGREHHNRARRNQREAHEERHQPRRAHGRRWVRAGDQSIAHDGRRRHGVRAGNRALDRRRRT